MASPKLLNRRELRDGTRELGLRRRDLELRSAVLHRVFGAPFGVERFRFVEVAPADRRVCEHRDCLRLHFQYAAGDEDELFLAAARGLDANLAGPYSRDQ